MKIIFVYFSKEKVWLRKINVLKVERNRFNFGIVDENYAI